jgi:hypothetical protein
MCTLAGRYLFLGSRVADSYLVEYEEIITSAETGFTSHDNTTEPLLPPSSTTAWQRLENSDNGTQEKRDMSMNTPFSGDYLRDVVGMPSPLSPFLPPSLPLSLSPASATSA